MFALLGLFASLPSANAGGLGLFTQAGLHQGYAYYYDLYGAQGIDSQYKPHYGVGIEGVLGDKDDRLKGIFRMSWNQDQPLTEPQVPAEGEYFYSDEEAKGARNDGLIAIGLQWGIWGEPTGFEVVATTLLTSGFWTVDSLEYFVIDIGAGATYSPQENMQFFGVLSFAPRYRKQFALGGQATVGARVFFD